MIVSTSDTHLCFNTYVSLPAMNGDTYRSFIQIVDHAVEKKASSLILAGDVFDGHPESTDVECFLSQIFRLKRAGVKVYAIQGQHGRAYNLPWTSIDPYVIDLNEKVYEIEPGVFCSGFDNLPPDALRQKLQELDPRVNLLVLHQLAKGTVHERDGQQAWDLDPEWIPAHVKLVLLGDYHDTWEYQFPMRASKMIYHGSTAIHAINEPAEKSFVELHYHRAMPLIDQTPVEEQFVYKRIPLKTRPFLKFMIATAESLEEALKVITEAEPETFIYVAYDPQIADVEARVRAANKGCHIITKSLAITSKDQPVIAVGGNITLDSCYLANMQDLNDPAFNNFMVGLLRAPEKPKYLEEEFKKLQEPAKC